MIDSNDGEDGQCGNSMLRSLPVMVMPSSPTVWLVEHPTLVDEFASRSLRRRRPVTQTSVSSFRMP